VKLATWNVNSIRARLDLVLDWLQRRRPDVLCLQETKVVDDLFPAQAFSEIGYFTVHSGQQTYNGVGILSLEPVTDVRRDFPLADNDERRLISGVVRGLRVYSAYIPNGRDPLHPFFPVKLAWIDALGDLLLGQGRARQEPVMLMGDFNVAPEPRDVYDPVALEGKIHFSAEEHAALERLRERGLVDAFRVRRPEDGLYSWWDYRQGAFRRNLGYRIDHIWITPDLTDRVVDAYIDRDERAREHSSDHAPVVVELEL